MAKRGCCRVHTIVILLLLSIASLLLPISNDSSGTDWHQTTDSELGTGVFSNTELIGSGDSAYIRLSRLNQWAELKGAIAPPARDGHRMVFDNTSDVFVLFGGRDSSGALGDTWLYHDSNDTWTRVFPSNPPVPRFDHAMAYDFFNDVVILFGGDDGTSVLGDTYVYSVSGNTWTNMNPSNPPDDRSKHDIAYDSEDHQVVLFGGNNKAVAFNDTWTYSVSQNEWLKMSPASSPSHRYGHTMSYDPSEGKVVLFGGSSGADVHNDTWTYDNGLDDWAQAISLERPTSRKAHSMTYGAHTGPVLFGGWENSDSGASEQWDVLGCNLSVEKKFTTLTRFGDYLYIGSADFTQNAWIYRYSDITGICEPWKNTGDYFIYSAFVYDDYLFFGTRNNTIFAEGNLFYTDGTDLYHVPGEVWWRPDRPGLILGGWIQDFKTYNGKLFASGSSMVDTLPSWNNFFVKVCDQSPCTTNSSWQWTNTSKDHIDLLDDGLVFETFEGNLYLGTYDYASVLRYYPGNSSWWYSLNGSVDGNRTKGGRGVYALIDYDGCLRAFTAYEGWNWTLCQTDGNWIGGNVTEYNGFVRGLVFRDRMYISANESGTQVIASNNGTEWTNSLSIPGNDAFLYMTEFDGSLYATSGQKVYRKRVIQNDLWSYSTSTGNWSTIEPTNALPPPRQGHSLTYDWRNDVLVLFGGKNESSFLNDTWVYNKSSPNGVYTSSTIDTSVASLPTFWTTISWEPQVQIDGTELKFQLASNNDSITWVFRGPDGTSGSYYDNPTGEQIWSGHQGNRYLRCRAYFGTMTPLSPRLSSITVSYYRPPFAPSLTSPQDDVWTNDGQPEFMWAFMDPDPSDFQGAFQVLIDDQQTFTSIDRESGKIMSGSQSWQPQTPIPDGTWYWTVRAMDNNGYWSDSAPPRIIKVDTSPPFSSLSSPVSASHLTNLDYINGTSQDNLSGTDSTTISINRLLDGNHWNGTGWQSEPYWLNCTGTSQWTFDASSVDWVSERQYSITSRATDVAGNLETPAGATTFIFDSTAPTVTVLNPVGSESPEGGTDIDIQWTAADTYLNESSIRISYSTDGGASWNMITGNQPNDGSYNWTLPRMKADMRIMVEAEDLAGNIGSDSSGVFYVRAPEKEEDWLSDFWWVILIIVLLAVCLVAYYLKKRASTPEEETSPPPIVATAGETTMCAVCLGTVKEGLSVIKCGDCGKTFHEKCAARIEKCPNCDSKLDMSELEEE